MSSVGVGHPVPIIRVQDWDLARTFYVDYLGFAVLWEHRFEPDLPRYVRIQRDAAVIDCSEHYGDGTPGIVLWVPVDDVEALHRELVGRRHGFSRPGIDRGGPGGDAVEVIDPWGNRLRFAQSGRGE